MKNVLGKLICQVSVVTFCSFSSYGAAVTSDLELRRELAKESLDINPADMTLVLEVLKPSLKQFITNTHSEHIQKLLLQVSQASDYPAHLKLFLTLFAYHLWENPCSLNDLQSRIDAIGRDYKCTHYWPDEFTSVAGDTISFIHRIHMLPIVDRLRGRISLIRHRSTIEGLWIAEIPDETDFDEIKTEINSALQTTVDIERDITEESKECAQSICTYLISILDTAQDKAALKEKFNETLNLCLVVLLTMIDDILNDVRSVRPIFFSKFPGMADLVSGQYNDDNIKPVLPRVMEMVSNYQGMTPEIRPVMILILQELLRASMISPIANGIQDFIDQTLKFFKNIAILAVRDKTRGRDNVFYVSDTGDENAIKAAAQRVILGFNVESETFTTDPDPTSTTNPDLIENIVNLCLAPLFQQVNDFRWAYNMASRFESLPYFCREVWPQTKHCNGSLGALFSDFVDKLFAFKEAKKFLENDSISPQQFSSKFSPDNTSRIAQLMVRQSLGTIVGSNPNVFPESIAKDILYWQAVNLFFTLQNSQYQPLLRQHLKTIEYVMNNFGLHSLVTILNQIPTNILAKIVPYGAGVIRSTTLLDALTIPEYTEMVSYLDAHRFQVAAFERDGYQSQSMGSDRYKVIATDNSRNFIIANGSIRLQNIEFLINRFETLSTGVGWFFASGELTDQADWAVKVNLLNLLQKYLRGTVYPRAAIL
ncbi:MAG: hypothetical protein LBL32_03045 [Holosporales bacterium]|jgi:hypothetical protein|nr:hypothetical protein [Holosporales bacterium]